MAAELPSEKAPPVYAPAPTVLNWTGVYVGGQVGIQWGQTTWDRFNAANTALITSETAYYNNGVVGGGHIGYNYQVSQFVFGLEGDVEGTNYNGNGFSVSNSWANTTRANVEASIRARAGYAWNDLLLYLSPAAPRMRTLKIPQWMAGSFMLATVLVASAGPAAVALNTLLDSNWSIRIEDRFSEYGHHDLYTGTEDVHEGLWDNLGRGRLQL